MKSVLISIKPKWCELIKQGKKTVEIRKTRPKIDVPFKVYIYETKTPLKWNKARNNIIGGEGGKVIGEFVCDRIDEIGYSPEMHGQYISNIDNLHEVSCVNFEEMFDYIADGFGYGWHISNLVIYDKPKELNEFFFPPEKYCEKELCGDCPKYEIPSYEYGEVEFDCEWERPLARPPQSWCYVKELMKIKTLEGIMTVSEGDYIIKGVQGEFYPCKPDIFEETYEQVENEPQTNYDKITESVESLAEFIEKYATNCHYCPLYKLEKCKLTGWKIESENCKKEIKEWLQKECEG